MFSKISEVIFGNTVKGKVVRYLITAVSAALAGSQMPALKALGDFISAHCNEIVEIVLLAVGTSSGLLASLIGLLKKK